MEDIFTLRFREAIKTSGITQVELANRVKISKQCISDFKSGKSFPSIQTLRLLCKYLDVSADYLLGLESY
ncbi:helix-turn-helix domain-containing protein [Pumilibacter muris]|jgi:transcriptional regulator with XRE-family HTH domain|uniref:helix-turn-helix domain-containing protein n=1 Tax=Pumilibacter muris TaxID=2941510 RepID=UPI003B8461D8